MSRDPIPSEVIHLARGEHVIIDADLAVLYRVSTRALNQAVKRNRRRFPRRLMFRLTKAEAIAWLRSRSQSVILKRGTNLKYLPLAFTEHGALMVANVLQSRQAVRVSLRIIDAFVELRKYALTNAELAQRLSALEQRYDGQFQEIFEVLRGVLEPAGPLHGRKIGFTRFD